MTPRNCSVCGVAMSLQTIRRATVDVCEDHGIWLDSGELERIVKRVGRG